MLLGSCYLIWSFLVDITAVIFAYDPNLRMCDLRPVVRNLILRLYASRDTA